ncbi:MAG: ABC transporter ATP-binding protein [Acidimicrobiia bacterium]|nr:ABC transporter ATP-binding protein [Acidimicrobiia bacterium]
MTTLADDALEARPPVDDQPVITLRGVEKYFPVREGVLQHVVGHVRAVDGVSFEIMRGQTLGLVGESGCGKTTLGRCIAGLTDTTGGGIYFRLSSADLRFLDEMDSVAEGQRTAEQQARVESIERAHRIDRMKGEAWRSYRRNCQFVFQDAFSSLNPRHLVKDIVGRPLRVYKEASGAELTEQVVTLLESVGLGRQHLYRYPHQFSGGQRQRISIARAIALDPEFIVLDEPTSALDVSVQSQILNLLHELQRERGLTYLFITHDLGVVRLMSDDIVVMYVGEVMEHASTRELFASPRHPYTEALLAANPDLLESGEQAEMKGLEGTVPDPARPPRGCKFHTRCAVATPRCGWEVDDVVSWLSDNSTTLDALSGVERSSDFDSVLRFADAAAAAAAVPLLRGNGVPQAMGSALVELSQDGPELRVRFDEVDRVRLEDVGEEHLTSCILHTSQSTRES